MRDVRGRWKRSTACADGWRLNRFPLPCRTWRPAPNLPWDERDGCRAWGRALKLQAMTKLAAILCVILLASSCGHNSSDQCSRLSEEFVYTTLSFSPSAATSAGLHEYKGQKLDDLLDDMSPEAQDRHLRFYKDFASRLAKLKPAELTAEEQVDAAILQDQTALAELELTQIRSDLHNPTMYVETLGNALFAPSVLEFAPLPDRLRHIIARLGQVPLFLDEASTNLASSPRSGPRWRSRKTPATSSW